MAPTHLQHGHPEEAAADPFAELDRYSAALEASEELLLDVFGISPMSKAEFDLSSPKGFDQAVVLMASAIRRSVARFERDAVVEATTILDIDWHSTTAQQRRRLVNDALVAAGRRMALVPTKIEEKLVEFSPRIFRAGKRDVRTKIRRVGTISIEFNAVDRKASKALARSNALFVTDAQGRRLEAFGEEAKAIVAGGLEQGLGRKDIAEKLALAAQGKVVRSGAYWEVVSSAFLGRARSTSQLLGYQEAGIQWYRIEAVLDQVTTEICRYLHGQTFSVGDGIGLAMGDGDFSSPEEVRSAQPWVREGVGPDGKKVLFLDKGDRRVHVATVERSGYGRQDDVGRFSSGMSASKLVDEGVGFPPYHGRCRSTTIPVM